MNQEIADINTQFNAVAGPVLNQYVVSTVILVLALMYSAKAGVNVNVINKFLENPYGKAAFLTLLVWRVNGHIVQSAVIASLVVAVLWYFKI